jgi:transcriptional regulator PpsR
MRFTPFAMADGRVTQSESSAALLGLLKKAPDAHVVIDQDGRILAANFAFLQMAQVMSEDQARGESLERWLGRSGVDVSVLIANLRQHGSVTLFSTLLRGEQGSNSDVELSGVALTNGNKPTFGLSIRSVGRRLTENAAPGQLVKSVEQLKELIGRVPLKDVVRETTDIIEKLCIEAALELTRDNRASAAEMLGLSRQSLYVKLRRFGLAETAEHDHEK